MQDEWQRRLTEEQRELEAKIIKLRAFITLNPAYRTLDTTDQRLLKEQRKAMSNYSGILLDRIARFTP